MSLVVQSAPRTNYRSHLHTSRLSFFFSFPSIAADDGSSSNPSSTGSATGSRDNASKLSSSSTASRKSSSRGRASAEYSMVPALSAYLESVKERQRAMEISTSSDDDRDAYKSDASE